MAFQVTEKLTKAMQEFQGWDARWERDRRMLDRGPSTVSKLRQLCREQGMRLRVQTGTGAHNYRIYFPTPVAKAFWEANKKA